MNNIFSEKLDKFVLILINGILIYSKTKEAYKKHLRIVLQTMMERLLYVKLNKCDFYKKQIKYLGHIIIEEGIVVGPNKIKFIMSWIIPKILTSVGSLVSLRLLSNNYSRILKGSLFYHFHAN